MTPSAVAASSPPAAPTTHGLSFRAKLVLGVCGLVLLTGTVVLWLAHRSARASTEALTGSVFREVSRRAATQPFMVELTHVAPGESAVLGEASPPRATKLAGKQ